MKDEILEPGRLQPVSEMSQYSVVYNYEVSWPWKMIHRAPVVIMMHKEVGSTAVQIYWRFIGWFSRTKNWLDKIQMRRVTRVCKAVETIWTYIFCLSQGFVCVCDFVFTAVVNNYTL